MKTLSAIVLSAIFACIGIALLLFVCGCGGIEVYSPDGKLVAREFSVLKNVGFQKFTAGAGGTSITGGSGAVDDAAVEKIVEGVVAGVVKGVK